MNTPADGSMFKRRVEHGTVLDSSAIEAHDADGTPSDVAQEEDGLNGVDRPLAFPLFAQCSSALRNFASTTLPGLSCERSSVTNTSSGLMRTETTPESTNRFCKSAKLGIVDLRRACHRLSVAEFRRGESVTTMASCNLRANLLRHPSCQKITTGLHGDNCDVRNGGDRATTLIEWKPNRRFNIWGIDWRSLPR